MSMEVVNGYVCRNCTDVDYAKKSIDPAHPKDGPNGVDAPASRQSANAQNAQAPQEPSMAAGRGPAVVLGGQFAGSDVSNVTPAPKAEAPRYTPGSTVNLSA
jgi:hypothetical protein